MRLYGVAAPLPGPLGNPRQDEPAEVVSRQLTAYNAHDVDALASEYSETVQVFSPLFANATIDGLLELREFCRTQRFDKPALHAELLNRMTVGNKVIDHYRVWGLASAPTEVAVVYEVLHRLIERVWLFPFD